MRDPAPYRRPTDPEPSREHTAAPDLGPLRSTHERPTLTRALVPAIVVAGVFLASVLSAAPHLGVAAASVGIACAALLFAVLAVGPVRRRNDRVTVYADGVEAVLAGRRDAVAFDDVNEVWFDADVGVTPLLSQMVLRGLRLVDHAGVVHRLPLHVHDGLDVVNVVLRRCSLPLLPDARAALRAGETLTFAGVRLTREGIDVGGDALAWQDVSLVRTQPGRIVFLRRGALLPWKTVEFGAVPHPTLFLRLVAEHAPRIENDNPLDKWFG